MSQQTESKPAQEQREPAPRTAGTPQDLLTEIDPHELIRPKSLAGNVLPRWFMPAMAGVGVVVGFALSYLISGFSVNYGLWFAVAAIVFVVTSYVITRQRLNRRKATDGLWRNLIYIAFALALIPLVSVIWSVTADGIQGISRMSFWSEDMSQNAAQSRERQIHDGERPMGGGVLHAIIGSLLVTLWATVISVPIGLLTSIYLVEYSRGGALSRGITFFVDVMTGIPSIVAGLFGAAAVQMVLGIGGQLGIWSYGPGDYRMGLTAAVALSVLMIPVVVRTTEEMLRVVPNELREASYALGVRKWRTILKVVIPTAISGIAAGVTLAIARVIGETAPILLTAGMLNRVNWSMLSEAMMTLPVYIYWTFTHPVGVGELSYLSEQRAWGAALVLIMIVMALNLIARIVAHVFAPKKTGR